MTHDKNTLDLAREWAATVRDGVNVGPNKDRVRAAADLISSLPDEWVGADRLRKYISDWREGLATAPRGNYEAEMLDDLEDMLPASPKPADPRKTLADMAPEERAECQWMQADLKGGRIIIGAIADGGVNYIKQDGKAYWDTLRSGAGEIVPLPDLPRMEWPGNEPEDDVAAATGGELTTQDVVDECRAVRKERAAAESASPRKTHGQPEPRTGEAWLIDIDGERTVALLGKVDPADDEPTWFTDDGCGYSFDSGNPVARLVPETTEQDPPAGHAETEVTDG